MNRRETGRRPAHPVAIRMMHWIGVYAMGCMIFSGWEIYDASPSLPFLFPAWTGLGGWLGGALAWHLSAMWLLFADGIAVIAGGAASSAETLACSVELLIFMAGAADAAEAFAFATDGGASVALAGVFGLPT